MSFKNGWQLHWPVWSSWPSSLTLQAQMFHGLDERIQRVFYVNIQQVWCMAYIYIHTYVYQIIKKLYIYHLSFWCLYLPSWNRWFVRWDRRCQPRRLRKGEYDQSKQGSQQSPCACGTFDFILPLGSFQVSLLKSRGKSLEFLWCIQWKDMNIKDQSILFCQNFSWNKMRYQRTQPRQMQPVLVQQPWYLYQGLIMSHTMSTRQKLQFLLGMFDLDDKDAL